jgi:CheY-like chemotaxis protein/nitrogen-specific signal transduction histidine kinase
VQTHDGIATGTVVVFRDESDRRRAQVALQDADRRKDEFLATLAHELRNPLAPICMGLDLLRLSGNDPQTAEEVRGMMQRQAQHMVRLIDDLLDVSRITRGNLELRCEQVQLADIVRDAVAATRPLLEASKHELKIQLPNQPVLLDADASRLTQVLTNLLNNALKYTPPLGRIELTAANIDGVLTVAVSDSGIGIPHDKIGRVFEMFTQIHEGRESGHTGLGIGLALVKRLVEMHGGSVDVHSPGQNLGTTFVVRLPASSAPANEGNGPAESAREVPPTSTRKILVVDDNVDAVESLSRLVAKLGNEVSRAHDGLKALEVGRTFHPDVVLMDLGMPNLNGYEAARRMRQEPWGRDVLLIAMTGWGQDDDRRRTSEAGFDHHLVKPVELAALRRALDGSRFRPNESLPVADAVTN